MSEASTSRVERFLQRCSSRAQAWRWFLGVDVADLVVMARHYAERMHSSDLGTHDDILRMFRAVGFVVEYDDVATVPGELVSSSYIRIVARKTEI